MVTLLVLAWQVANWYGAREWQKVVVELEKEGETLDVAKVGMAPVAEERNFCAIPALKDLALDGDEEAEKRRSRLNEMALPSSDKALLDRPTLASGLRSGQAVEMKAWASWLAAIQAEGALNQEGAGDAAREVLARLANHEALYRELAVGLDREEAQWTPTWSNRAAPEFFFALRVPHYTVVQKTVNALALRSIAATHAGEREMAHTSLQVMLRLNRACRDEGLLIGTLVGATGDNFAWNAVWELSRARCGTMEDFRKLETELARADYRLGLLRSLQAEMAGGASSIRWLKRRGGLDGKMKGMNGAGGDGLWPGLSPKLLPDAWYDLNAVKLVRTEMDYLVRPLRDEGLKETCEKSAGLEKRVKEMKASMNPFDNLATLAVPAFIRIVERCLYTQVMMDQALIACVLERFRLENEGRYPESLAELTRLDGRALPVDLMSEKAMGYALDGKGRYRLWSVGWDGIDDGGKRVVNEQEPMRTKFSERNYVGDWVWDFAP
jgi:hypothetical protein